MTTSDPDNRADEGFRDVLAALEQMATRLDAQNCPAQAWPVTGRQLPRRRVWKIFVPLGAAAAAAIVAILIHYCTGPQDRTGPTPGAGNVAIQAPTPSAGRNSGEPAIPRILIVEDLDSYSIIDLMTGVPLVSFATKDSFDPICVVPVLTEPPSQAATMDKRI
jgi:hypothetical protein